jgi:hypothetical protein
VKSVKFTEPDESVPDALRCGVEHLVGLCALYLEPITHRYTSVARRQVILMLMPQPCMHTVQGRDI